MASNSKEIIAPQVVTVKNFLANLRVCTLKTEHCFLKQLGFGQHFEPALDQAFGLLVSVS